MGLLKPCVFIEKVWNQSIARIESLGINSLLEKIASVSNSTYACFWLSNEKDDASGLLMESGQLTSDVDIDKCCLRIVASGQAEFLHNNFFGLPVTIPGRNSVGVLCSTPASPHSLSSHQLSCLESLAQQVSLILHANYLATELQLKDEALEEMNQLSNLGKFSMFLAHEINNGLALIKGSVFIAMNNFEKNDVPTPEIMKQQLSLIQIGQARIQKIVNGIKFYSRHSTLRPNESVLVSEIFDMIDNLVKNHCRVEDIHLHLFRPDGDLRINCCPTEISQILMNLIHNSIDAIDGQNEKWIKVEAHLTSKGIEFSVTDSGTGIPDDLCSKIMAPFFTTKERGKGTGLGLSISKDLVEKYSGQFFIDRDCINTRFVFVIPLN